MSITLTPAPSNGLQQVLSRDYEVPLPRRFFHVLPVGVSCRHSATSTALEPPPFLPERTSDTLAHHKITIALLGYFYLVGTALF